MTPLDSWAEEWERDASHACCIDIETCAWNGPIAIVGIYRPKEGEIKVTQLVRGISLTADALRAALAGVRLIVTFNGSTHDLPKLHAQFPGVIPPDARYLDLFHKARRILKMSVGLKCLEQHFSIDRPDWMKRQRPVALRLWQRYSNERDFRALRALLAYNREDTVNLYFLANKLAALARQPPVENVHASPSLPLLDLDSR